MVVVGVDGGGEKGGGEAGWMGGAGAKAAGLDGGGKGGGLDKGGRGWMFWVGGDGAGWRRDWGWRGGLEG